MKTMLNRFVTKPDGSIRDIVGVLMIGMDLRNWERYDGRIAKIAVPPVASYCEARDLHEAVVFDQNPRYINSNQPI